MKNEECFVTNNPSFYEAFESGPQYLKLMDYITTILSISALLYHGWISAAPYIMSQMGEKDVKKQYHKDTEWENLLLGQQAMKSLANSETGAIIF